MKPVDITQVMQLKPGESLVCKNSRRACELAILANRKKAVSQGRTWLPEPAFKGAKDDNGVARVWRLL